MGKGKAKSKRRASSERVSNSKNGKSRLSPSEPVVELEVTPVSTFSFWPPPQDEDAQEHELEQKFFKVGLSRERLLKDNVYLIPNVLNPEECSAWVAFAESRGFLEAKHAASAGMALRDNGRYAIHSPEIAQSLFQRMKSMLFQELDGRRLVGLSANIRLYRYVPGQRFNKHYDESCEEEGAISQMTILIYLSDADSELGQGLEGGETRFYAGSTGKKELLAVSPKLGAALCHFHGERCLMHEGAQVKTGVKYLFRTDVLYA